jgi:Caspase domain
VRALSLTLTVLCCALPAALPARASDEPHRIAVLLARNDGGADRPILQYTHSDAQKLADVLVDVGGVQASDVTLMLEPDRRGVLAALARVQASAGRATELFVYYSGHSDADGLILGDERIAYAELKKAIHDVPAGVRVVVLDSCAAGAFTKLKGGVRKPGFLSDQAVGVIGTAVLTASSDDESAQESTRLRGSFFTHSLVTGMRGAADASLDGRVSLMEAYQYAFADTLARTEGTSGGAQHAAFDMRMSGSGDLVMTDLRDASSTLVLADEIAGRVFVRDARGQLIAEMKKGAGAPLSLALAPGRYAVTVQGGGSDGAGGGGATGGGAGVRRARIDVGGAPATLSFDALLRVDAEPTTRRGGFIDRPSPALVLGTTGGLAIGAIGSLVLSASALYLHVEATTPDGDPTLKSVALTKGPLILGGTAAGALLAGGSLAFFILSSMSAGLDEP